MIFDKEMPAEEEKISFPLDEVINGGGTISCPAIDRLVRIQFGTVGFGFTDPELVEIIAILTKIAIAKGLLPAKEEASAPVREFEPEHPFYPLPEYTTPAALIEECVQTAEGDNHHAVAYVAPCGLLIVEPIGNQRSTLMAMQFDTSDLRAMLALKEHAR